MQPLNFFWVKQMGETKITFEPPRCPECGANLFRVAENTYETYTFDYEKGLYVSDGESESKCLNCDAKLYDVFPDGVCNYRADEFLGE